MAEDATNPNAGEDAEDKGTEESGQDYKALYEKALGSQAPLPGYIMGVN